MASAQTIGVWFVLWFVPSALAGCGVDAAPHTGPCAAPGARYATAVVAYEFGPGQDNGRAQFPANVYGPPRGAGCCEGSLDAVSLGNGGTITLEFGGNTLIDGPGPDFTVFENAFETASGSLFAELASVEVSADGSTWAAYPCAATAEPYDRCAGVRPVLANPDVNDIDPLDPAVSGGDAFDLSELGVGAARLVRITDRADLTGLSGVFDLDAVAIIHAQCP
jgi:hypothetical protein